MCGTKQKALCTVQKEGEKRKHQNAAAKKQNYPLCMCVCVCVCLNENAASLQPADHRLSGSPGGMGAAPAPPCVHVCVLQSSVTKRYADDLRGQ